MWLVILSALAAATPHGVRDAYLVACRSRAQLDAALAPYFARWLEPESFGARTIHAWSFQREEERERFAELVDREVLAPQRVRLRAAFCDPRDELTGTSETTDGVHRFGKVWFRHDDFQLARVFVKTRTGWRYDHTEVPSVDLPNTDPDPVDPVLRDRFSSTDLDGAIRILDAF